MSSTFKGNLSNLPAVDAKSFSLADGVEVILDDVIAGDTVNPKAWIPNEDGVLSIKNGSGVIVPIPVIKGLIYPIVAKEFRSTGTTGVTSVIALG